MQTKSWMTISVMIAGFTLASCQPTPQNILIGKKASSPPKVLIEPLADTDNDGVPDELDNCPNTPKGIKVNPYGCPIAVEPIGYLMIELRVFFERNSDNPRAKILSEIVKVADKMTTHPEHVFVRSYLKA